MALVALVEADDHRRHPLERASPRQRSGVERPACDHLSRKLERECLCLLVVAADEGVLLGAAVRQLARGERVEAGDHRAPDEVLRALGERQRVGRAKVAGDAQHGRRADRICEGRGGGERAVGLRGEHDDVHTADGILVCGSARRADLVRLLLRAFRIAGPDHHLVARLDEACGKREPEGARPADHRHPHAGTAPMATSASRRRASASLISVRVTIGRTAPSPSRSSASASSTTNASIKPS